MKHNKLIKRALAPAVAAVMLLGTANQAAAAVATYNFGDLLPGQSSLDDSSIWATLTVTTDVSNKYIFNLSLADYNFRHLFGDSAYVSEAIFNTPRGSDPTSTQIISGGVTNVRFIAEAPLSSLGFDFGDCFGKLAGEGCGHGSAAGKLTYGESVMWSHTFSSSQGDPINFGQPPVALHVQSITLPPNSTLKNSGWYGPAAPVPEPESYALLLAGLGLLGLTARRRKQST